MKIENLIAALRRLKVQTGSLACLGCGHEHNCSTSGCAIIREAVDKLCGMEWIDAEVESRRECPGSKASCPTPLTPRWRLWKTVSDIS